jgi:cell division protein FtsB
MTGQPEDTLVDDVFNFLNEENVNLSASASTGLTALLRKHARRAEGNNKAKEVLRLRIKAEEAKNMELSLRNNTLQAELEAARATVDLLQWEKEQGADG